MKASRFQYSFPVFCTALFLLLVGVASGATVTVCKSGCNHTSIQAAVNNASNGDTIELKDGSYIENVDITKSVNIIGSIEANTGISAASKSNHVFHVKANSVNITGVNLYSATGAGGIYLDGANNSKIENVNSNGNRYGVLLRNSNNNILKNVKANRNNQVEISSRSLRGGPPLYERELLIEKIPPWSDGGGIILINSHFNTIEESSTDSNIFNGIALHSSNNNILLDNTASFNEHFSTGGWTSEGLLDISTGISLGDSKNNTLIRNSLTNNDYGIWIVRSNENTFKENTIESNVKFAILSKSSLENTFINNHIKGKCEDSENEAICESRQIIPPTIEDNLPIVNEAIEKQRGFFEQILDLLYNFLNRLFS